MFGVRLPGDEQVEGGLSQSELQDIAALIAQTGKEDFIYWNISIIVGTNYDRLIEWPHEPLAGTNRTNCTTRSICSIKVFKSVLSWYQITGRSACSHHRRQDHRPCNGQQDHHQ